MIFIGDKVDREFIGNYPRLNERRKGSHFMSMFKSPELTVDRQNIGAVHAFIIGCLGQ